MAVERTEFRLMREKLPKLPVVLAGFADLDTVKVTALRAVKDRVPLPMIAGAAAYRPPAAAERGSTFLVLGKEDIATGSSQEAAMRALRAHFGWRDGDVPSGPIDPRPRPGAGDTSQGDSSPPP